MNIEKAKAELQIIGSRIVSLDIKNMFVFLANDDETIERSIDASYEVDEPFHPEGGDGEFMCTMRLEIAVSIKKDVQEANISLVTEGAFTSDAYSKEELKEMVAINGTAALYSISRGIIATVTGQMCEGGAVLTPMLNVYEMNKETSDN